MNKFYFLLSTFLLCSWIASAQLDITGVTLTFTPETGAPVVATATDNGTGLMPDGAVTLMESTPYTLEVTLRNGGTDITNQVRNNDEDFQVFYELMSSIFNGDVDATDMDSAGLPVGLANEFTTECTEEGDLSGTLRVVLANLGDDKDDDSDIDDGTAEFDVTWTINVEDDADAPPCENEEEVITDVTLTFTSADGSDVVTAVARDPDGEGPQDLQILDEINLTESTEYTLTVELLNAIEGEDITEEIQDEDDEHQFFFAFTDEIFRSPAGDGNADNREDPINYNDFDENGLPVGLSTGWETECGEETTNGTFRIVLKHQPGVKDENSTINDGGTDIDLTFVITVEEDPDAPPCENEEEVITDVTLTFTSADGSDVVTAVARDPDGEGPQDLQILDEINLLESTEYTLTVELLNAIEGEDITEEIMEEDDEHQFFFAFTDEIFRSPAGDGNTDNRDDPINYNDFDENGLPVGLSTDWETECGEETSTGTFRIVLKHQPGVKDENSTVDDGGTDIDLTFVITVEEDPDAPPCENEEEVITDVTLTFTSADGSDVVTAVARDPDGEGPQDLQILDEIDLTESTEYTLTVELLNAIEGEDITEEIMEEDDEHQFFFAFTDEIFRSPAGDGNADNRDDPINYNDFDENGLPVGLSTDWETECGEEETTGTFRIVLKHQPGVKDENSTINDGGTDIDLTFVINVNEDPDAPPCENEEEVITDVILTFTSADGSDVNVARAQDPDGEGPQDLQILDDIELVQETEYTLTIELTNAIEDEDITEEIMEEDDEHQFFFEFTDGFFADPMGNGNADDRDDPINYNDFDENGLPVGLSTTWTTPVLMDSDGTFRVVLKHQPDVKDENSTINDGGTDIDLTFTIRTVFSNTRDVIGDATQLQLFPNPVREQLNWQLDVAGVQDVELFLYNQMGQLIQVYDSPNPTIATDSLQKGTYMLQVRSGRQVWTKRFVKL
ncbi:MAG: T9SS type A sorting domain-containing protein [Bacteroidota bacterium]